MPRYHFRTSAPDGVSEDEEGVECADLAGARAIAIDGIRGILAEQVRHGILDIRGQVDIALSQGAPLMVVRFDEALTVGGD